jgi:2,4-dienoyl-CoA reductase-like NADH-dependent reductase (Old Yellow Enzyme family)
MTESRLFSPFALRGVTVRNRAVLAPMQMYVAEEGRVQPWHHHHLAKFALGGFSLVFTEALAVERRGRNTYGDLGVWLDDHVEGLRELAQTIRSHGAVPAAQLWHAGPKASRQRPWEGYGPLGAPDAARGELEWQPVAPVGEAKVEGWHRPHALGESEVREVVEAFGEGARRCREAGYELLEVHGAHGYLVHSFYSPLGNDRTDAFGGDREGRMAFPLEVARAIRRHWPEDKPLLFRLSCIDDDDRGGWTLEDTLVLASRLREEGVDMIDCSSGGIGAPPTLKPVARPHGFQVPFADRIRAETGMPTMAVGLIRHAGHAERILAEGRADLICIAREALHNPHWPLHAALELEGEAGYRHWPSQYGWWLQRRARNLARLDEAG